MPLRIFAASLLILVLSLLPASSNDQTTRDETRRPRPASSAAVRLVSRAVNAAPQASWPQFLGPHRDNRSSETGLMQKWPDEGPALVTTISGFGVGFSDISIADGVVYSMGNRDEREFVFAYRLDSGEKVWEFDCAAAYHNGFGDGPRSTPTIDGERLFALGATGELVCLERKTGTPVWRKNIVKEFGSAVPGWGICESVLIDEDHVICTPGGKDATLAALDKSNGNTIWKAAVPDNDRIAYSSIIAIDVGGVKQYVQVTAKGTIGIRASDGKFLWRDDSAANGTANCCAPVATDGMVFTASGYGKGGSMVELSSHGGETSCLLAWHANKMQVHHGGLTLVEGYVYASSDSGGLTCLELKTGKMKWQNRSVGKGSVTWVEGKLIVRSEQGPVACVAATPEEYRELGRFSPKVRSNKPAWPYPVVTGGKLFLRDQDILQIYDVKGN